MRVIRAFVPFDFFNALRAFNAEVLNGNSIIVRAWGAQPRDGSLLRSKEYLLFGHGLGTLPQWLTAQRSSRKGYMMNFTQRAKYWEINSCVDQKRSNPDWKLKISNHEPDPDMEGHVVILASQPGTPGQYIYLAATA